MTLYVATLLWDANAKSESFSRCYDETWVEKLHAGFRRNLSLNFCFVCFTDRWRSFSAGIDQLQLSSSEPGYANCIEPYKLDEAMILTGLDTIITGNVDHLAAYAMTADKIALPRDPFWPERACNGVALVPGGNRRVYRDWAGENDMDWMRAQPHAFIDDLFPGQVVSFKGHVKKFGLGDARIVYFHGAQKPHELPDAPWITEHWRAAA